MIVLSAAGSGKTMVLTERVIHLIEQGLTRQTSGHHLRQESGPGDPIPPQEKAERKWRQSLVCTFHSLGYRILKAENSSSIGLRLVQNGTSSNFSEAMQKVGMEDDPASVMKKISLAKNDLVSPEIWNVQTKRKTSNLPGSIPATNS